MSTTWIILKRELRGYFSTPIGYVFIVIFLFLCGLFTFQVGKLFERDQATLEPFFIWHPWLYLFLIPAVSMRLWAEERKSGTIELLLTMPLKLSEAILGKFLAAWIFIAISLGLTFPVVLTVQYLGDPDMGVVVTGYFGSLLMAGTFLAIGICMSALTKNQVVSFILAVVTCLLFILAGFDVVLNFFGAWAPAWVREAIAQVSFLTHFNSTAKGLITGPDLMFFVSLTIGWLCACGVLLEMKKAQ